MIRLEFEGEMRVVDVETTGLNPGPIQKDRAIHNIISVCVMSITFEEDGTVSTGDPKTWVVNPGRLIPPRASKINGFRNKDVKNLPPFREVAQEIRDVIGKHPLVGHNVAFDKRFLHAEFRRADITGINQNRAVCTMKATGMLLNAVGKHSRKWGRLSLDRTLRLLSSVSTLQLRRRSKTHEVQEDVELTGYVAIILHQLSKMPKDESKVIIRNMVDAWPEEQERCNIYRERARRNKDNADAEVPEKRFGCLKSVVVAFVVVILLLSLAD